METELKNLKIKNARLNGLIELYEEYTKETDTPTFADFMVWLKK